MIISPPAIAISRIQPTVFLSQLPITSLASWPWYGLWPLAFAMWGVLGIGVQKLIKTRSCGITFSPAIEAKAPILPLAKIQILRLVKEAPKNSSAEPDQSSIGELAAIPMEPKLEGADMAWYRKGRMPTTIAMW